jgi:trk system potassium uptake protein TrkA
MLDGEGHDVTVIDSNPASFEQLRRAFSGERIVGFGYDRHVLEQARIERADAFVAAATGDNRNIVAALAAKRRFRVPTVVARIYDPDRARIYLGQGVRTVSPVQWSAGRIRDILVHPALESEREFGNGEVAQVRVVIGPQLEDRTVQELTIPGDLVVAVIVRRGEALLPTLGTRFEAGDVVRFLVARTAFGRFESFVGMRP